MCYIQTSAFIFWSMYIYNKTQAAVRGLSLTFEENVSDFPLTLSISQNSEFLRD